MLGCLTQSAGLPDTSFLSASARYRAWPKMTLLSGLTFATARTTVSFAAPSGAWNFPLQPRAFSEQLLTVAVKTSMLCTGIAGHLHLIWKGAASPVDTDGCIVLAYSSSLGQVPQ
jgi:hypothetical protein